MCPENHVHIFHCSDFVSVSPSQRTQFVSVKSLIVLFKKVAVSALLRVMTWKERYIGRITYFLYIYISKPIFFGYIYN